MCWLTTSTKAEGRQQKGREEERTTVTSHCFLGYALSQLHQTRQVSWTTNTRNIALKPRAMQSRWEVISLIINGFQTTSILCQEALMDLHINFLYLYHSPLIEVSGVQTAKWRKKGRGVCMCVHVCDHACGENLGLTVKRAQDWCSDSEAVTQGHTPTFSSRGLCKCIDPYWTEGTMQRD